jgi:16S rRNA processing protein RimM
LYKEAQNMQSNTEWATIGRIVAPFGIHGEVKVLSLSDIPDRFSQLTVIYVRRDSSHIAYKIRTVRSYKGDMVVLKLVGIDDVKTAEALRNLDIIIPVQALAELPPDSYYLHDIIGLQVVTLSGQAVGNVIDIISTGSNDVYVIKTQDEREVLIPAIKEIVKQVDLSHQMMYIDPIKGLLDDEEAIIDRGDADESEEAL